MDKAEMNMAEFLDPKSKILLEHFSLGLPLVKRASN
jgi:hypothetical protein